LFKKRIYSIFLGTFVGKRKQTILKKCWFDITTYDEHTGDIWFGIQKEMKQNYLKGNCLPF
jgi:hypothetical protein